MTRFTPPPPALEIQGFGLSGERCQVPYYVMSSLNAFPEGVPPMSCGPGSGSKLSASLIGSLDAVNKCCDTSTNAIWVSFRTVCGAAKRCLRQFPISSQCLRGATWLLNELRH